MKKFIFASLIFLFAPLISFAADYKITDYYIDTKITDNGDMDITELIVMKGSFNGYEVGIEYKNGNDLYSASGISNVFIGGSQNLKSFSFDSLKEEFTPFEKVNNAFNGDSFKYTETKEYNKNNYRMYYKTNNKTTAFLFKYRLNNVVIAHSDVAEVYWNFFSEGFKDDIKNLNIRVSLPKEVNIDDINWWFHGDLAGTSEFQNQYIIAHLDKLEAGRPLDFRMLFDKKLLNESNISKRDEKIVRDEIIKEEDEIVAKDLELIKKAKKLYYAEVTLTCIFYISLVIAWIYVYFKYDKERKSKFQNEYNRDFIDDYNVEVIDYLMNKSITPNAMSASIMNLIYKKNISFEEIDEDKKQYKFVLENRNNLNKTENMLVDFLFNKVGSENSFTTIDLKKYASGTKTCDKFMNSYTAWNNQVIKDAKSEEFFENNSGKYGYSIILIVFAFIIIFFGAMNNIEFIPAYITVFFAAIFTLYVGLLSKKTEKGIEHYAKWKAFKNFLNDFGAFEIKELPEIKLWERYLVYATIFGLADKVEKAMNVKIKEINIDDIAMNNIYIYNHIHIAPLINSSISSAYRGAQTQINRNLANSSGGSFGGHGGGFSSGGGFGGGGRSGGGF